MLVNALRTILMNPQNSKLLLGGLFFSVVGLALTSWWLLFRDVRALEGIELFYPHLSGKLFPIREVLLSYGLNVIPTIAFVGFGVSAFFCYLVLLQAKISISSVLRWTAILHLMAFLAYPILSTDIFSYIFSDRVFTEYGQNIWKVTPDTYPEDKFFIFSDWTDQTKVYGAFNQIVYLPAAHLGNDDLLLTVVLYKFTALVFVFGSLWLLQKLTTEIGAKNQSLLIRLVFWNPLVILEFAGNGHNDILMIFCVLLSLLFWKKKLWLWAGVALAAAVQIKLIPVILFGFFGWYLLQKRDWRATFAFTGSFVIANAGAFFFMQVNPFEFLQRVLYNTSVYWQSLPSLTERFFPGNNLPFSVGFGVIGLGFLLLQWKKNWHPIFSSSLALLAYLLFFTSAYWNWYVLWVVFLIPFVKETWLKNMILAFSLSSLLAYPLLWLGQRYFWGSADLQTFWMVTMYLWLMGVPAFVGWLGWKRPKIVEKMMLTT
jgi:hypothetical protein